MIYIETNSTDVYYNFGLENYFTVEKRLPDTVFLFWRTTPTLMVGKYQNAVSYTHLFRFRSRISSATSVTAS